MAIRRPTGIPLAVVGLVLLAGCSGGLLGGDSPQTETTNAVTPTAGTSAAETAASGDGPFPEDPEPLPGVNESAVRSRIAESMRAVETYRVNGTVERQLTVPAGTVDATVETNTIVDRRTGRIATNETTAGHMQRVESRIVVDDSTLYRYVNKSRSETDPAWQQSSITEREWRMLDPLHRQRLLFDNATLVVTNETQVRNTTGYVVHVDVNETAYTSLFDRTLDGERLEVTDLTYRYVVDRETGRVLEVTGVLEAHTVTGNGSVRLVERFDLSFHGYNESVSIWVPTATNESTGNPAIRAGDGGRSNDQLLEDEEPADQNDAVVPEEHREPVRPTAADEFDARE
ncbi:MAG: hypothetical protein ACI9EZ_000187 [Halobacteriales archaeon]|jgi:hypothetical protein